MPYIKQEDREKFKSILYLVDGGACQVSNCGELNYLISKICLAYLNTNGKSYQKINDIMGALAGVQQELYRRCFGIYEDKKIEENGDIF